MTEKERMVFALQVWWVTYGMDEVDGDELITNYPIRSGFQWGKACTNGILTVYHNKYALTQKALDLIKEYHHGH